MSDVREKPIIFSGPMVRAIIEGRKIRRKIYVGKSEDRLSPKHLAVRLANALDDAIDGQCWIWRRTTNDQGYGTLTVGRRSVYAHRLAYELSDGPIPHGLDVMHSCDNPKCINPSHLSVGTRSNNMADCYARGRSRIPVSRMKGETNGSAKLTDAAVALIRENLAAGVVQRVLAQRFGVSQSLISQIGRGVIWND